MKLCRKCNRTLPATTEYFSVNRRIKCGLNSACKECDKARVAKHQKENPEIVAARQRKYRKENCDEINERRRNDNEENREKYREYEITKRKNNPEYHKDKSLKRHRDVKQATPSWADTDAIDKIYNEAKRVKEETGEDYTVDHIIPLNGENVCGLHVDYNLQLITRSENSKKSNAYTV